MHREAGHPDPFMGGVTGLTYDNVMYHIYIYKRYTYDVYMYDLYKFLENRVGIGTGDNLGGVPTI